MFFVKATYNNETRKFSFSDPNFPSYVELNAQVNAYHLVALVLCYADSAPLASPRLPSSRFLSPLEALLHSGRWWKGKGWRRGVQ